MNVSHTSIYGCNPFHLFALIPLEHRSSGRLPGSNTPLAHNISTIALSRPIQTIMIFLNSLFSLLFISLCLDIEASSIPTTNLSTEHEHLFFHAPNNAHDPPKPRKFRRWSPPPRADDELWAKAKCKGQNLIDAIRETDREA